MRMFSPHVFTRLRQNAMELGCKYGSSFPGFKNMEFRRNTPLQSLSGRVPKASLKVSWILLLFVLLVVNLSPASYAIENLDTTTIEEMSQSIDSESKKLGGTKLVADHLKESFQVDDRMINIVRDQDIDYGTMFTIFAMAERMPGGITEDNVTKVIDIHKGRLTQKPWHDVANVVGVEMDVVTQRARALISDFLASVEQKVR